MKRRIKHLSLVELLVSLILSALLLSCLLPLMLFLSKTINSQELQHKESYALTYKTLQRSFFRSQLKSFRGNHNTLEYVFNNGVQRSSKISSNVKAKIFVKKGEVYLSIQSKDNHSHEFCLLENVKNISFYYFDGSLGIWEENWDKNLRDPLTIKIHVEFTSFPSKTFYFSTSEPLLETCLS